MKSFQQEGYPKRASQAEYGKWAAEATYDEQGLWSPTDLGLKLSSAIDRLHDFGQIT